MIYFDTATFDNIEKEKKTKGKVQKKKLKQKLTSVSFMYVCVAGNCEMLVFFSFFFPTIV